MTTPHLLGRSVGRPGDVQRQREVVLAALRLLETAEEPPAVVEVADARSQA